MFLNTEVVKELYYGENCSDGTSCIKAFPSRHRARPLCLPSSAILQECGKPRAGRALGPARSSRHSSPCRCPYRRKPGPSRPSPPLRCGPGVGSRRAPSRAPHLERRRDAGRAPGGGSTRSAAGPVAHARTHTRTAARGRGARGRGRRARYLFCQPWRRLVYLLSTPSSAGSRLRPPPPDGLAATEPGLLRLPPPPRPATADRLETPRPAREQEGDEPAEVARLLLRLLLLLPPPPSAPWAALSMVRARRERGGPPRWRPRRWGCWRGGGGCYSSRRPGRAWLLQIPGKCLTHTGGRGGGEGELGRKPTGLDAAAAAPPPAAAPAPAPPSALVSSASSESGWQVRRALLGFLFLFFRVPAAAQARGRGALPGAQPQGGHALSPSRSFCRPLSEPEGRKGISARSSPPPTHLGTWREGRPHPPGPPGYGPARPGTGTRAPSLPLPGAPRRGQTHIHGNLEMSLTGRAK